MAFYALKPYHLVELHYVGNGNFNLKFFNPYGVEMEYPSNVSCNTYDLVCNDIEKDKLYSSFLYNCCTNFTAMHKFVVQNTHLIQNEYTKVNPVIGL